MAMAATAAALREARVYRGRDAIAEALVRMAGDGPDDAEAAAGKPDYLRRHRHRLAALGSTARPIFSRLAALVDSVARARHLVRPGRSPGGAGRRASASTPTRDEALGHLFAALDDHGLVLDGVGRGDERRTWPDFAAEVESLIRDLPPPEAPTGSAVRFAAVDEAAGLVARHVLLTDLAEGTFPDRSSVSGPPTPTPTAPTTSPSPSPERRTPTSPTIDDAGPRTCARPPPGPAPPDLRRQPDRAVDPHPLRPRDGPVPCVVGMAERSLTLAYPTADEKGVEQLAAGFLEEVEALLTDEVRAAISTVDRKLDPALRETTPQSAAERRIRAMARAASDSDPSLLFALAGSAEHRPVLMRSAAALLVNERRSRQPSWVREPDRRGLGRFEGMLRDPRIVARLAEEFGSNYTFSASQLESLAFCPFQFFSRYVLRLDPIDERDELEEDRTAGGSRMHAALEALHLALRDAPPDGPATLDEAVADHVERAVREQIDREVPPASAVGRGLRAIEAERMVRVGKTYAEQFAALPVERKLSSPHPRSPRIRLRQRRP